MHKTSHYERDLYSSAYFFPAPSAPPEALTLDEIYSDSIELSWSPPPAQHHNGEIIGFNVAVAVSGTGVTITVFSVANSTTVGPLTPFTTYTYSVSAVTSAGAGPFSTPGTVTTAEAGMVAIASSKSTMQFIWCVPSRCL